jgi:nicotinamidase/pyrazinamidase
MKTLLLVDIQNDFLPGGALPVPDGDQVVPVANRLLRRFALVVATQDWHPPNHGSFASQHPGRQVGEQIEWHGLQQTLWPDHCVQQTRGAQFPVGLDASRITHVVRKGTAAGIDSYSGFFDNARRQATGLESYLHAQGVTDIYLLGLATDYCVLFTAQDALPLGFRVHLVEDGCRGVNLQPGDVDRALAAMDRAGVRRVHSAAVAAGFPPIV